MISKVLGISEKMSQEVSERNMNFSAISPNSLKHYSLERPLNDQKINYPLLFEEI
jgi:hypothetical protein